MDWDDLSDDELRERLTNRGVNDHLADLMVDDRDCCNDCRTRIGRALGE